MIADRTYHKLLHVDWIVADIDGDGIPEYIPASDQAGKAPPQHAYSLATTAPSTAGAALLRRRDDLHGLGGRAGHLQDHGVADAGPRRSTASVFKFVW